ncbi:hypothetical protein XENTR_v10003185 [Xenopus tropicalis]|nr:hypothetical protein XENTR_v10003185 [Xenopus tropicalis]
MDNNKIQINLRRSERIKERREKQQTERSVECVTDYRIFRLPQNLHRSQCRATEPMASEESRSAVCVTGKWKILLTLSLFMLLLLGYMGTRKQSVGAEFISKLEEYKKDDTVDMQKASEKYLRGLEIMTSKLTQGEGDDEEELRQTLLMMMQLKETINGLKAQRQEVRDTMQNLHQQLEGLKEEQGRNKDGLLNLQ